MFKWLPSMFSKESSQGDSATPKVIVRSKGRDEWSYREGDRQMVIYAELLSSDSEVNVDIDFGSIWKWSPPFDDKVLSWDERDRILKNFCSYLDSKKITYSVKKSTG